MADPGLNDGPLNDRRKSSLYARRAAAGDESLSIWSAASVVDAAANSSDKLLAVPALREWMVIAVFVDLTTTATVGTRQVEVQVRDAAGNVVASAVAGVTQAASGQVFYTFGAGLSDLATLRDTDKLTTPLAAGIEMGAAWDVRVFDNKAVDAAADDMIVHLAVMERVTG